MEIVKTGADLAQIGTFIVAIVALAVACWQITVSRNSQRETTAKDVFRDYLRLSFDHPKYGAPTEDLEDGGWSEYPKRSVIYFERNAAAQARQFAGVSALTLQLRHHRA